MSSSLVIWRSLVLSLVEELAVREPSSLATNYYKCTITLQCTVMYCILRPHWSFKSDERCPLKMTASPLKVTAGLLKMTAGPLKVTAGPLNMTTGWGHLSSHLKDQGGLKIQYITVHYKVMVHFWKI